MLAQPVLHDTLDVMEHIPRHLICRDIPRRPVRKIKTETERATSKSSPRGSTFTRASLTRIRNYNTMANKAWVGLAKLPRPMLPRKLAKTLMIAGQPGHSTATTDMIDPGSTTDDMPPVLRYLHRHPGGDVPPAMAIETDLATVSRTVGADTAPRRRRRRSAETQTPTSPLDIPQTETETEAETRTGTAIVAATGDITTADIRPLDLPHAAPVIVIAQRRRRTPQSIDGRWQRVRRWKRAG